MSKKGFVKTDEKFPESQNCDVQWQIKVTSDLKEEDNMFKY